MGINRLSIGLQSTDNDLLKSIGRIHTYGQFLDTYKTARKVGFKNINVDLMLALPKQHLKDLKSCLEKIVQLNPEHISVYSLILEENTILYNKFLNREITLPTDFEEREMYWQVKTYLESNKYEHYEISNFALNGCKALHNTNCWEQKEYIGIGAGASSFLDEKRYINSTSIEDYINSNKRILEEVLNKKSKMQEYIMLGLRKLEGINLETFKNKFNTEFLEEFKSEYDKLCNEGLLIRKNGYIKLSNKGIDLANLVWEEFV